MNKEAKSETLLKQMVQWFNEREEVTRKMLMNDFSYANDITVDCYRNYLTKAGYLEWTKRGAYRRKLIIPESITESELRKKAYGKFNKNELPVGLSMNEMLKIHKNEFLKNQNEIIKKYPRLKKYKNIKNGDRFVVPANTFVWSIQLQQTIAFPKDIGIQITAKEYEPGSHIFFKLLMEYSTTYIVQDNAGEFSCDYFVLKPPLKKMNHVNQLLYVDFKVK